jgi:chloramphenicol 3-O phosphotransferase
MDACGHLVILNGPSSSGKTELARCFRDHQASSGRCWLVVGIDDFFDLLPAQWLAAGRHLGPWAADGVQILSTAEGITIVMGETGRRLFQAYRRTAVLWARSGFDVIVDDVCFAGDALTDWELALAGMPATWVAIDCDERIAQGREQARGDRLPGMAKATRGALQHPRRYDIALDTSETTPDELATQLAAALARRP